MQKAAADQRKKKIKKFNSTSWGQKRENIEKLENVLSASMTSQGSFIHLKFIMKLFHKKRLQLESSFSLLISFFVSLSRSVDSQIVQPAIIRQLFGRIPRVAKTLHFKLLCAFGVFKFLMKACAAIESGRRSFTQIVRPLGVVGDKTVISFESFMHNQIIRTAHTLHIVISHDSGQSECRFQQGEWNSILWPFEVPFARFRAVEATLKSWFAGNCAEINMNGCSQFPRLSPGELSSKSESEEAEQKRAESI